MRLRGCWPCMLIYVLMVLLVAWFVFTSGPIGAAPMTVVKEHCVSVNLTKIVNGQSVYEGSVRAGRGKITWWDCTKYFSDGTKMRRIGDLKP